MPQIKPFSVHKQRFWEGVDVRGIDECWPWTRSTCGNGYGKIRFTLRSGGKQYTVMTHRFAMMLHLGHSLKSHELVLHECDNPKCCNPNHLFVGDQIDNMQDCVHKDRTNKPKGSKHHKSKVTEKDVISMRQRYKSGEKIKQIARDYGVTYDMCRCIIRRLYWKHV